MLPKKIAAQTMEDITVPQNSSDEIRTEGTSEPHVVVACPSCRTKFAVESTLVAAYETPRFHCSRCDSVFELQQQDTIAPAAYSNKQNQWILDDSAKTAPSNHDSSALPSIKEPTSSLKSTDFTLGPIPDADTLNERAPLEPIESRAGLSLLGFWSGTSRETSTSLTRSEARALATTAQISPVEPATQHAHHDNEPEFDPLTLFDTPGSQESPSPSNTQKQDDSGVSTPPARAALSAPITESELSRLNNNKKPTSSSLPSAVKATPPPLLSRFSQNTQNLIRLGLPVVIVFGMIGLAGLGSTIMPRSIDSVFGAVMPGFITGRTAHLPPPELSVQDLNLSLEKTQSKEIIPVIRGFIQNGGESIVEDVAIEALGFNSRGEIIVRARAPLHSALSREKISDLPLDTVKKFQSALSASDASIKPGNRVPFSVALFLKDASPHEVTYFSARVFSVGRVR